MKTRLAFLAFIFSISVGATPTGEYLDFITQLSRLYYKMQAASQTNLRYSNQFPAAADYFQGRSEGLSSAAAMLRSELTRVGWAELDYGSPPPVLGPPPTLPIGPIGQKY